MRSLTEYKNHLISTILSAAKSKDNLKIGLELEGFVYNKETSNALTYNTTDKNLKNIMEQLHSVTNFKPTQEDDNILVLSDNTFGSISLEPGSQLEYSGIPYTNIAEMDKGLNTYYSYLTPLLQKNNLGLLYLGYNPLINYTNHPIIPKKRSYLMYNYMPKVGSLGKAMMLGTATCQVNLDFCSESDLGIKMHVGNVVSNLLSAIFSNSPIINRQKSLYNSYRLQIWQETDNQRSGLLPFVFDNFTLEKYVDFLMDIPMYFVIKNNNYISLTNVIAKDYFSGNTKIDGVTPTYEDLELHMVNVFPDVRIKPYLEIRTLDSSNPEYALSIAAFYKGIFYNNNALSEILELIKNISYADLKIFKSTVPIAGLDINIANKPVIYWLQQIVKIAYDSLIANKLNEEKYLLPLLSLIDSKTNLSTHVLSNLTQSKNFNDFLLKSSFI